MKRYRRFIAFILSAIIIMQRSLVSFAQEETYTSEEDIAIQTEAETSEAETAETETVETETAETETAESETAESETAEAETIEMQVTETEEEITTEEMIPEDDIEYLLNQPSLLNLGDVNGCMRITSCVISGSNVIISGNITQHFSTWDHTFYLFKEEMYSTDITTAPIAQTEQGENFTFTIPLNEATKDNCLYSKFYAGVKFRNGEYYALTNGHFITNPEALAQNQSPYPIAKNKKGIFAELYWGSDIAELGASFVTVNINIAELFINGDMPYTYEGNTYYYSSEYIGALDAQLKMYQQNDIIVNAIILAVANGYMADFRYPGIPAKGTYQGWNVITDEGVDCVSAVLHFLAERYSRADGAYGHIAGWIVGNEVNADYEWNYTGHQPIYEYSIIYANMLRITYQAVRSCCAHARVYMPLDMYWNHTDNSYRYNGKDVVSYVNAAIRAEGNIAWGIAYHPYPNPLTETEWWNDNPETGENASFVNLKNISVLTDYMQRLEMRDPDGSVKHLIFSEQGYTSYSPNQGDMEWKQAAAFAYAYYTAVSNPYVDAFNIMRQKDASLEVKDGLHQGLWYDNALKPVATFGKKAIWTVFKYIDTADGFSYTDPLAPLVGLKSFSSVFSNETESGIIENAEAMRVYGFNDAVQLEGEWKPEFQVSSFSDNNGTISVIPKDITEFSYCGIVWRGTADFSQRPVFGLSFNSTVSQNQNLRVQLRFYSGNDILEAQASIPGNSEEQICADLSGFRGRAAINRIEIWVQSDAAETWSGGAFTVSDIVQAASAAAASYAKVKVESGSITRLSASGFRANCNISSTESISKVTFEAWNVKKSTSKVLKYDGVVNGKSAYADFLIKDMGNLSGAYKVRVIAYDKNNIASEPYILSANVPGPETDMALTNAYAAEITSSGFRICAEAWSSYGLTSACRVYVWTSKNGQDDMKVYPLNFVNGTASVYVKTSEHKNETDEYSCHVYAVDKRGAVKVFPLIVCVPSLMPTVTAASVTNVTAKGYLVSCVFNAPLGISRVAMPTWTENDGQDDLVWHEAAVTGNTAMLYVSTLSHKNESGRYYTHIYVVDRAGNISLRVLEVKVPEDLLVQRAQPEVNDVSVTEVSRSGYRVTAHFTAPLGIGKVLMPTWTEENGQDDIIWHTAQVRGNTASFYVKSSDHHNEGGNYITHVYVYDKAGAAAIMGTEARLPQAAAKSAAVSTLSMNDESSIAVLSEDTLLNYILKVKTIIEKVVNILRGDL